MPRRLPTTPSRSKLRSTLSSGSNRTITHWYAVQPHARSAPLRSSALTAALCTRSMNAQPVFATVATEVASLTRISDFLATLRTEIAAARTLEQAGANQRYRWFLEDAQEDLRNLSRELNSPDSRTSSGGGGETPRRDGSIDGHGIGAERELEPHEAHEAEDMYANPLMRAAQRLYAASCGSCCKCGARRGCPRQCRQRSARGALRGTVLLRWAGRLSRSSPRRGSEAAGR